MVRLYRAEETFGDSRAPGRCATHLLRLEPSVRGRHRDGRLLIRARAALVKP
jgi:hypothetical protein